MGIFDSIKKLFGGGGSSEPAAPEASTPAPEAPETAAPEIGGGMDVGSGDQTPTV